MDDGIVLRAMGCLTIVRLVNSWGVELIMYVFLDEPCLFNYEIMGRSGECWGEWEL